MAAYSLAEPPFVSNNKLVGYDGAQFDLFGISVDVSPDGSMALVGASQGTSSVDPGAVYVFPSLSSSSGIKLTAADPSPGGDFGHAVALSDDGSTAVIGSPDARVGGNYYQGAVYIFTKSGGWTHQAKLVAKDGARESFFGCAVDISDNGNTVIIGSCSNPSINSTVSSVYVYVRQNGKWSQQGGRFRGNDTRADDDFGSSVALSGDGNTALVGARGVNSGYGTAYVFVRSGASWSQQATLTATDATQWGYFGKAVDLSDDGKTALVGADWKDAAYVFTRTGSIWAPQKKLTALDGSGNDRFGSSVSLSNNGNIAVVGAKFVDKAYLFVRGGSGWSQQEKLVTSDPNASYFGGAIAVSDDGKTVLVGADDTTVGSNISQGAVYVFRPYIPMTGPNMLLLRSP